MRIQRQRAPTIEDFGDTGATAKEGFEITARQLAALHPIHECVNRIRRHNWMVLIFIGRDQGCEHIQLITLRCIQLRIQQRINAAKRSLIISFRSNRANIH
ncbi:MAG: hypothetical protein IPO81_29090 [Kouleothrix sp.]|nr:hypothetical protein [Kouleothrix sp.]